jgi:abortive infection bacteriophage resistance protein
MKCRDSINLVSITFYLIYQRLFFDFFKISIVNIILLCRNNSQEDSIKKAIAKYFGLPSFKVTENVFHGLTIIRNICAHHGRLWNREISPRFSLKYINSMSSMLISGNHQSECDKHLYNYLVIIERLLKATSPNTSWTKKLIELLNTMDNETHTAMRFPDNWQTQKPWCDCK